MKTPAPDHDAAAKPSESAAEGAARRALAQFLRETPIPDGELIDNLSLYIGRKQIMDLLALDALYRRVLTVPGVIMEFGTRWGRHLASLSALRALHEPYNVHRRIVGVDTLSGFPSVSAVDRGSDHAHPGGMAVTPGYEAHLNAVLSVHESTQQLSHVRRTLVLVGDVKDTLPRYLADNPQTVVALAYFDLDLYEPTKNVLAMLLPYLTEGSVLAFDQLGHAKWPGETVAVRELLGTEHLRLELLAGFPGPAFVTWTGQARAT